MAFAKNTDFRLQLDIGETTGGAHVANWLEFSKGVQAYGQAYSENNTEYYYIDGNGAPENVNEGVSEAFTISGHRNIGDDMQDWLFQHKRIWNLEPDVRKVPYRYYNRIDNKGEEGVVSISYTQGAGGNANERAVIGMVLNAVGVPEEYTHTPEGRNAQIEPQSMPVGDAQESGKR